MQFLDQAIEIIETSKDGIDGTIVGDVVAKIQHRWRKKRGQPHRVDAQPFQIVDMAFDALQVTLAIAVCILKGKRNNLVDYSITPPFRLHLRIHPAILQPALNGQRWR